MDQTPQPGIRPKKSLFRKIVYLLFAALAFWSLYIAGQIYSFSKTDETKLADVAIVLGAGIRNDRPSGVFRERIKHAIDLYQRGLVEAIILTGGVGPGNDVAGSEVARQYAIEHGMPLEHIFIETTSTDTLENLTEAKHLMASQSFQTALIVSDPLHMYRAMVIAGDLDMNANPSPTPTSRIDSIRAALNFLAREVVSVTVYFLFPTS